MSSRLWPWLALGLLTGCAATVAPQAPSVNAPPPAMATPSTPSPAPAPLSSPAPTSAAPARPAAPPTECLEVLDRMSRPIPREESGPALRAQGLRIRSPIMVPVEANLDPTRISAVRVRMLIDNRGRVVTGSVNVLEAIGDTALVAGIAAAAEQSLSFDVSAAFSVPKEFPFTTVYVNCARP